MARFPGFGAYPESPHPYANAHEDLQSYTLDQNPRAILVSFAAETDLEAGFDFLHVTDGAGAAVPGSPFTGRSLAGRTLRVEGPTVRGRWPGLRSGPARSTWRWRRPTRVGQRRARRGPSA